MPARRDPPDLATLHRLSAELLAGQGQLAALQRELDRRLAPAASPQQAIDEIMPLLEARAALLQALAASLGALSDAPLEADLCA